MAPKWDDGALDVLQAGIERIRHMAQQVSLAHELVAENNDLLQRDCNLVRFGPLREYRDLRTHESQLAAAAAGRRATTRSRRRR